MTAPAKLAAFVAVLALLFAGGALAGDLVGPDRKATAASDGGEPVSRDSAPEEHGDTAETAGSGSHGAPHPVRGLAVAEDGLRVVVEDAELRRGRAERLAFRVVDDHGETVRDFDVEHTKRMHLILARRDLTGFQHLHPKQRADGTWTTSVRLDAAGSYRLFADFSFQDEAQTLAADLRVDGDAELEPVPAPRATAVSDGGYEVSLDPGETHPGEEAELRFSITRDGAPVRPEPYLGAGGHLVALRDGDMAYLHVHPTEDGYGEGDPVGFAATFPTEGRYRLFLQFQHAGRVQTVAFSQDVK